MPGEDLPPIPDTDDPWAIVARLGQPAVPGSYLVISHPPGLVPLGRWHPDLGDPGPACGPPRTGVGRKYAAAPAC